MRRLIRLVGLAGLLALLLQAVAPAPGGGQVGAQLAPAASETGTVVNFGGSDKLLVRNDQGVTYRVQYVGVRGPVRSSLVHAEAAAFHGPLVLGKRVRLESDGKDEDEGYKLRHVFLEASQLPLSVAVAAAGWATAVPYPVDHRYRAPQLQAQREAMARQLNLWQPGRLGPSAPWRPAGSSEPGYVAADPRLHPHLDLLNTVPTGQRVISRLVQAAPAVVLEDLGEKGALGYASAIGSVVYGNTRLLGAAPHLLSAVLAHEGTHIIDFVAGQMGVGDFTCFQREIRAFSVESQVWLEFFGPGGMPDPQHGWERAQNNALRFYLRNDLENLVTRSANYERQCAVERE